MDTPAASRFSGVIAAGGPMLSLALSPLGISDGWRWWCAIASAALVSLGGLLLSRWLRAGRAVIALGAAGWVAAAAPTVLDAPVAGVLLGALVIAGAHFLWPVHRRGVRMSQSVSAAAVAVAGWPTAAVAGVEVTATVRWSVAASLLLAGALGLMAMQRHPQRYAGRRWFMVGAALATVGLLLWSGGEDVLPALHCLPVANLLLRRGRAQTRQTRAVLEQLLASPARVLLLTFLALVAVGTVLLRLPAATDEPIALVDAAFTATSAVCVTGLIVLDTPTAFTPLGHVVILLLIQIGGLGIMAFSTAAIAIFGGRVSLKQEALLAQMFAGSRGEVYTALWRLLGVTFAFELIGAAALTPLFASTGDSWGQAAWRASFTSISAFCNAGFALQTDSLIGYADQPAILWVISLLIVAGGLSPSVIVALPKLVRGRAVSLQTKLVLLSTSLLLLAGFVLMTALEWSASMDGMSWSDKLHNGWFQSVTLRTAGFNAVDYAALRPATVFAMTAFMFVGGASGGTAGGVKVTTAAVLVVAIGGTLRGRWEAVAFKRKLPHSTVYKAAAIATVAMLFIVAGVTALTVTQSIDFLPALFEVVSALATVGLSVGATAELDGIGKLLIMGFMYVGRVGPLTLFLFLRDRHREASWSYPPAEVEVG